jgi:hypothetical protein
MNRLIWITWPRFLPSNSKSIPYKAKPFFSPKVLSYVSRGKRASFRKVESFFLIFIYISPTFKERERPIQQILQNRYPTPQIAHIFEASGPEPSPLIHDKTGSCWTNLRNAPQPAIYRYPPRCPLAPQPAVSRHPPPSSRCCRLAASRTTPSITPVAIVAQQQFWTYTTPSSRRCRPAACRTTSSALPVEALRAGD